MLGQSLLLCCLGGGLGIGLALFMEPGIAKGIEAQFPGFAVQPSTIALAAGATLVVGLVSGAMPAWAASRKRCVDALRSGG